MSTTVGSAVWNAYLGLWIAFRTFSLSTRLVFDFGFVSAAYLGLAALGFVPLVGFMLGRPFLNPAVWRAWLLLLLLGLLVDRTFYAAWFLQPPFDREWLGVLLAVPAFAATYLYSSSRFRAWTASEPG